MSRQDLRGSCPGLPLSNAEQHANPNRRCLPMPIPSSNHKAPIPETEVGQLTRAHPGGSSPKNPSSNKEQRNNFLWIQCQVNISLEAAFGRLTWWVRTAGHLADDPPWSFSILHMGLGSLGRSGAGRVVSAVGLQEAHLLTQKDQEMSWADSGSPL